MRLSATLTLMTGLTVAGIASAEAPNDNFPTRAINGTGLVRTRPTANGPRNYVILNPKGTETIQFGSGFNETDDIPWPNFRYNSEPKFNVSPLSARTYTGFSRTDGPGPKGSVAITSGGGNSSSFTDDTGA